MKKGGKTPKNATKGQSPTSAGQLSCGSCKKYDYILKNSTRPWRIALRALFIISGFVGILPTKMGCNNIRRPSMVVSDIAF